MDVTVVIPAGPPDRWPPLVRAVASACSQTHCPAEVVVVVDHDTAYFRRARRDLAGVTVLENDHLAGAAGANDTGAFHARTALVGFLGHDTIADPGWLAHLTRPFTDPGVVGAGSDLHPDWRNGRPRRLAVLPDAHPAGTVVRRAPFREVGGFGHRGTELPQRLRALTGGRWSHVPGALVRQEVPARAASFPVLLRRCFALGRRFALGRPAMRAALPSAES